MKHSLHTFVERAATLALFFIVSVAAAFAQGTAYVGYCDGQIATATTGTITGLAGSNATVNMAIRLPQSTLQAYKGCAITGVHFGIPTATKYPDGVIGWVRTEMKGANVTSGTLVGPSEGWQSIPLDASYTITGDEAELWIGVEYPQTSKLSIISFAGETSADACWTGKNGNFTDYSSRDYGSLAIEAIIEGDVPTHNLSILSARTVYNAYKLGAPISIRGTVKNLASADAVNPVIRYSLNGAEMGTYTIPATVAYRGTANFSFSIPSTSITQPSTAAVDLELEWGDGSADEAPEDNLYSLTTEILEDIYYRNMVVEEATGAWCPWCVRGIVGLREMRAAYPDRFIGIAVHNSDTYTVSTYDNWIGSYINDFPSCIINRDGKVYDPNYSQLYNYYNALDINAIAGLEAYAVYEGGQISFHGRASFISSYTSADYRIVFVITEDNLPITQQNAYAGGSYGVMGGFESLPSSTRINVDDIARGIYPTPGGVKGSVPATIEKGVSYDYSYTTTMPTYADGEKLAVIGLLVNAKTGEIVQGCRMEGVVGLTSGLESINDVVCTPCNVAPEAIYDLQGRRVDMPASHGVYVMGGKKFVTK